METEDGAIEDCHWTRDQRRPFPDKRRQAPLPASSARGTDGGPLLGEALRAEVPRGFWRCLERTLIATRPCHHSTGVGTPTAMGARDPLARRVTRFWQRHNAGERWSARCTHQIVQRETRRSQHHRIWRASELLTRRLETQERTIVWVHVRHKHTKRAPTIGRAVGHSSEARRVVPIAFVRNLVAPVVLHLRE